MSCHLDDDSEHLAASVSSSSLMLEPELSCLTIKTPDVSRIASSAHPQHQQVLRQHAPKRERTSSSSVGGYWEPDQAEIHALTMGDFDVMGVLGVGTYGVVKLARHVRSGASVALKVLSKEHVVSMRQEKHILRERTDDDCLYLVIEYLPGGELWSLLYAEFESEEPHFEEIRGSDETLDGSDSDPDEASCAKPTSVAPSPTRLRPASPVRSPRSPAVIALDAKSRGLLRNKFGGLKEEHAAFYLGCILCSLEYLHRQDIVYRDLKLENLVLDRKGYPKVLDFGFAKPNAAKSAKNMTLCGSMDYMAPEIVLHEPHDQRADIWSFGIIMYELLLGKTPFYHENPRELGRKITSEPVRFPNDFEEEYPLACELIGKLLVKTPDDRVRSMEELKQHSFFTRIFPNAASWERLLKKQQSSPFVPKLSGPFDTSFFQTVDESEQEELEDSLQPYYEDGSNIFREF